MTMSVSSVRSASATSARLRASSSAKVQPVAIGAGPPVSGWRQDAGLDDTTGPSGHRSSLASPDSCDDCTPRAQGAEPMTDQTPDPWPADATQAPAHEAADAAHGAADTGADAAA